ncbi:hypothetical protein BH09PSE5_BH09PSE5_26190 [soil metagenome]
MPQHRFKLAPQPPLPVPAAAGYEQTALEWSSPNAEGVTEHRDIAYGPDPRHQLDIFTAPHLKHAPMLFFWHGGGWSNGYKEYVSFMAANVIQLGFVLVAPTYRLVPDHKLPAALDDCFAAIDFVCRRAAEFGGRPDQLVLSGHSAGGHLATLTALRRHEAIARDLDVSGIKGCMPVSGIMDLHHPAPTPGSLEERVYTTTLSQDTDDAVMSPLCWAAGNTVPMVLSYGEKDSPRVILSNRRLAAMLALQPAGSTLRMRAGEDHFQTHLALNEAGSGWYADLQAMREGFDA